MSVKLIQVETTYEVDYKNNSYMVTILSDNISFGFTQYDVYNSKGKFIEGDLEEEVVTYLEENIP
jgi:hypothetical protein